MEISDVVMICAVFAGPVVAVQVQKFLEKRREKELRKVNLFKSLMATREVTARTSQVHVQALNMIDIEFYGKRPADKEVIKSWKEYREHLNDGYQKDALQVWFNDGERLFIELLLAMAKAVGYDFEKVELKRGVYTPEAYGNELAFQQSIREGVQDVLSGNRAIAVRFMSESPGSAE